MEVFADQVRVYFEQVHQEVFADDPLSGTSVTDAGYAAMTGQITGLAQRLGHGRVLSVLEGGYNLEALAKSAVAHVKKLNVGPEL